MTDLKKKIVASSEYMILIYSAFHREGERVVRTLPGFVSQQAAGPQEGLKIRGWGDVFIKDLLNEKVLILFLPKSREVGQLIPLCPQFRRLCVVAFATHLSTRAFVVAKSQQQKGKKRFICLFVTEVPYFLKCLFVSQVQNKGA